MSERKIKWNGSFRFHAIMPIAQRQQHIVRKINYRGIKKVWLLLNETIWYLHLMKNRESWLFLCYRGGHSFFYKKLKLWHNHCEKNVNQFASHLSRDSLFLISYHQLLSWVANRWTEIWNFFLFPLKMHFSLVDAIQCRIYMRENLCEN